MRLVLVVPKIWELHDTVLYCMEQFAKDGHHIGIISDDGVVDHLLSICYDEIVYPVDVTIAYGWKGAILLEKTPINNASHFFMMLEGEEELTKQEARARNIMMRRDFYKIMLKKDSEREKAYDGLKQVFANYLKPENVEGMKLK